MKTGGQVRRQATSTSEDIKKWIEVQAHRSSSAEAWALARR